MEELRDAIVRRLPVTRTHLQRITPIHRNGPWYLDVCLEGMGVAVKGREQGVDVEDSFLDLRALELEGRVLRLKGKEGELVTVYTGQAESFEYEVEIPYRNLKSIRNVLESSPLGLITSDIGDVVEFIVSNYRKIRRDSSPTDSHLPPTNSYLPPTGSYLPPTNPFE